MKVTIVIPYKEDRGFLNEAIESVEKQTYKNIELILSKGNNIASINANNGIKKSTGDLIRYLCEDDLLTLDSVEKTVEYFENNKVDFVHSNAINFWKNKEELWIPSKHKLYKNIKNSLPSFYDMLLENRIHGGTVTYKKKCFKNKMFDEVLWSCEEYDFNLWLLKNNYKLGYLNHFTYKYRRHDEQKSLGKKARQKERSKLRKFIRSKYE
jgi:glycosyltransferase involved in cell wall biosynthesis